MKVVCLIGSPRIKGNGAAIAERFLETAENLGAETETFALNRLDYMGCQGCMSCKGKHDKCVLDDDLAKVLDAVSRSDVLVLATAVYLADVTSQTKAFIDRSFSFLVPDFQNKTPTSRLSGKKLVFILTQGQPGEEFFADIFPKYDFIFQMMGFEESFPIRACGLNSPDDVKERKDILGLAEDTARKILG